MPVVSPFCVQAAHRSEKLRVVKDGLEEVEAERQQRLRHLQQRHESLIEQLHAELVCSGGAYVWLLRHALVGARRLRTTRRRPSASTCITWT